MNFQEIRKIL